MKRADRAETVGCFLFVVNDQSYNVDWIVMVDVLVRISINRRDTVHVYPDIQI